MTKNITQQDLEIFSSKIEKDPEYKAFVADMKKNGGRFVFDSDTDYNPNAEIFEEFDSIVSSEYDEEYEGIEADLKHIHMGAGRTHMTKPKSKTTSSNTGENNKNSSNVKFYRLKNKGNEKDSDNEDSINSNEDFEDTIESIIEKIAELDSNNLRNYSRGKKIFPFDKLTDKEMFLLHDVARVTSIRNGGFKDLFDAKIINRYGDKINFADRPELLEKLFNMFWLDFKKDWSIRSRDMY